MGDVKLIVNVTKTVTGCNNDINEQSSVAIGGSAAADADAMFLVEEDAAEDDDDEPPGGERGEKVIIEEPEVEDEDENDGGADDDDDDDDDGGVNSRRKKNRRGKSKKRKWKPYNKLTWDEKRELENRESRRANRVREERFAHGQPVAPYNTTQFLMDDRPAQEPDFEHSHREHRDSGGTIDSDEYYYSSPEDEEEFLQKEFTEVYDNIHAERLGSMTKLELIQEYMQLEERVEKLENRLKWGGGSRREEGSASTADEPDAETTEKIRIFRQEIRKLAEENEKLRRENEYLADLKRAREGAKSCIPPEGAAAIQSPGQTDTNEMHASADEPMKGEDAS